MTSMKTITLPMSFVVGLSACVSDNGKKPSSGDHGMNYTHAKSATNNSHYPRYDQERRDDLALLLQDLANHVDSHVKFGNGARTAPEALLAEIYKNRAQLMHAFDTFTVKIKITNGQSAVLLCDAHRELMEDSACTANIDAEYWQQEVSKSCEFKQSLVQVCK